MTTELLRGKRSIVTGAGKGIGRETALALARNGSDVCAASRNPADVETLISELRQFPVNVVGVSADVTQEESAAVIVNEANTKLGGVDAVVCVAGYPMIQELWDKSIQDLTREEILDIFKVDVLGSFLLVKQALPLMVEQKHGVVVLFSSTPAISGYDKGSAYCVSKAANLGLTKSIAAEYGKYNIRAYAIAPGNIKTGRTFNELRAEDRLALENETPMKRWGEPQEVANVIASIISDNMSFISGQTFVVDGGTVML